MYWTYVIYKLCFENTRVQVGENTVAFEKWGQRYTVWIFPETIQFLTSLDLATDFVLMSHLIT
jgi:hypothetical protein